MNYWLIIIPFISAFIGWVSVRILIKMLFHPRNPKKFAGITIQGIIPKRQQQLAVKLGKWVSIEFFSSGNLEQKISDPAHLEKIMPMLEEHIDDFLRNRLKTEMPMISMFIGDKTVNKLKTAFMKEIENLFPQVMKQYAGNMMHELDLEKMVINKISAFSPEKLEQVLYQNIGNELRLAGALGAVIGFIIGVIQVLIIHLAS